MCVLHGRLRFSLVNQTIFSLINGKDMSPAMFGKRKKEGK
jgi:hypothetical protein